MQGKKEKEIKEGKRGKKKKEEKEVELGKGRKGTQIGGGQEKKHVHQCSNVKTVSNIPCANCQCNALIY